MGGQVADHDHSGALRNHARGAQLSRRRFPPRRPLSARANVVPHSPPVQLASHMNPFGVTVGAILGHCFCTGLAVIGGSLIAKRISQRAVAATGGLLFFTFAFLAAVYGAPGTGDR